MRCPGSIHTAKITAINRRSALGYGAAALATMMTPLCVHAADARSGDGWLPEGAGRLDNAVSIHDFPGCHGDGVSDDSAAFAAAVRTQKPVELAAGRIYVTGPIVVPADGKLTLFSRGAGATVKLAANSNDHLVKNTTKATVWLSNVHFDGNRAANKTGGTNPAVIFNQIGTLVMFGGSVEGGVHDQILSGNVEYGFDASQRAELVYLRNVAVRGGTRSDLSADGRPPQDCYRLYRTKRIRLQDCTSRGGLSGARMGYYCDEIDVSGGHYADSFGDVGVTVFFTSRFAVRGVTSTGHFQHGIEIDGADNGTVTDCLLADNHRNGILLTEYAPQEGHRYEGTYDGITTVSGTQYPCKNVVIRHNVIRHNGGAGAKFIGQGEGVSFNDNRVEGNGVSGTPGENAGMILSGGRRGDDGITFGGNLFINSGQQEFSMRGSSVQFKAFSEGNCHVGGRHFEFATMGSHTGLVPDLLSATARWRGDAGTLVDDPQAVPGGRARRIAGTAQHPAMALCIVEASPSGDKLVVLSLRSTDGLNAVRLAVDLCAGPQVLHNVQDATTPVGSAYRQVKVRVPDNLGSFPYDNIRITVATNVGQAGALNIGSIDVFGSSEAGGLTSCRVPSGLHPNLHSCGPAAVSAG